MCVLGDFELSGRINYRVWTYRMPGGCRGEFVDGDALGFCRLLRTCRRRIRGGHHQSLKSVLECSDKLQRVRINRHEVHYSWTVFVLCVCVGDVIDGVPSVDYIVTPVLTKRET